VKKVTESTMRLEGKHSNRGTRTICCRKGKKKLGPGPASSRQLSKSWKSSVYDPPARDEEKKIGG